ncbi:hypothetical protein [Bradyrhizobium denitrificans]|uniref:hypothetical protein n=1 Tax=Bradyrhizobium denitrificans TaxID=2734912 RepID=UPI002023617C|nr:hypothetical protein [Bradyrhizobium denitrificans]MCL8489484.1 hypothetical protein [Bradyrhizobium denitrificans]
MNDDAERKLAAHETGYMCGPTFVALDDVLIWARAVAEAPDQLLASPPDDNGEAAGSGQRAPVAAAPGRAAS